jgi:predicted dehydrogenase
MAGKVQRAATVALPGSFELSRRELLWQGAAVSSAALFPIGQSLAAPDAASPAGALRAAVIGTGVRGKFLLGSLPAEVKVVAICDFADSRMAETLNPAPRWQEHLADFVTRDARTCRTYRDYRTLFEREQLDVAIIATPDHHHIPAALHALAAGLDVYLEKPLSVCVEEGRVLCEAVHRTGRILQVGSQQRSMEFNQYGCEFVRQGRLGKIHRVEVPGYPGPLPTPDLQPEPPDDTLDWNLFCGPAPLRNYHRQLWMKEDFRVGDLLWRGWDLFADYSGHLMTNWGAHALDMVQYALGQDAGGPLEIEALPPAVWIERYGSMGLMQAGRIPTAAELGAPWIKSTPLPAALAERRFWPVRMRYPEHVEVLLRGGGNEIRFYGELGVLTLRRNYFSINPADLATDPPDPQLAVKWQGSGGASMARPHVENWLACVRSRQQPAAPVEVGHRTATVCHLANIARNVPGLLQWDPVQERFINSPQAQSLLNRPRRAGFELPVP